MRSTSDGDRWEVELRQLREEIQQLRAEQQEMAKAIDQLVTTFRMLATHLGIASEPYGSGKKADRRSDVPGFG